MIKVTALSDIALVVNLRIPQVPDPERGIGPSRSEVQRITMRAGESRDDVVMVFGLDPRSAPPGSESTNLFGTPMASAGEFVPVTTPPPNNGAIAESFGVVRLEQV